MREKRPTTARARHGRNERGGIASFGGTEASGEIRAECSSHAGSDTDVIPQMPEELICAHFYAEKLKEAKAAESQEPIG